MSAVLEQLAAAGVETRQRNGRWEAFGWGRWAPAKDVARWLGLLS